jgi:hypothetical protein
VSESTPDVEARLTAIEQRLDRGSEHMGLIDEAIAENTTITREVLDLVNAFKGGMKVLGWLGTGAAWLGKFAAAGVAIYGLIYALTHGGSSPK